MVYTHSCSDCDFALINGGAIRGSLGAGNITYLDIKALYPFENTEVDMKIQGHYIRELLEKTHVEKAMDYHDCEAVDPPICATSGVCDSASCDLHGHYPQWSGLRWAYNPREDTVLSVETFDRVNGYWTPLDDDKEYKLVTNSFLAGVMTTTSWRVLAPS